MKQKNRHLYSHKIDLCHSIIQDVLFLQFITNLLEHNHDQQKKVLMSPDELTELLNFYHSTPICGYHTCQDLARLHMEWCKRCCRICHSIIQDVLFLQFRTNLLEHNHDQQKKVLMSPDELTELLNFYHSTPVCGYSS
ncbi:hypothetical protein LSH36_2962g00002, partial [Paralvinella palmiformis]